MKTDWFPCFQLMGVSLLLFTMHDVELPDDGTIVDVVLFLLAYSLIDFDV